MEINQLSAFISLGLTMMVVKAWWPLIFGNLPRWARFVIFGVLIAAAGSVLRVFYWDVVQWLSGANWPYIRGSLGGQKISVVFNSFSICASVAVLHGRVLLLPKEHRKGWHWWNVWTYRIPKSKGKK